MEILYEDNHIIIVNKAPGEIVQGDKTGDVPLSDLVKAYIKERYAKPGAVFLGVVHRLDRPVSGVVVFARTSKALERLNRMFANHEVKKVYHAIVKDQKPTSHTSPEPPAVNDALASFRGNSPSLQGEGCQGAAGSPDGEGLGEGLFLRHYLTRNTQQNKAYAYDTPRPGAKEAVLEVRPIARGDRYQLVEVHLHTGRHHQIRCQLAKVGIPIRGDLKYGAPRSLSDGSISLHARSVSFEHPVSHKPIYVEAPYPADTLWSALAQTMNDKRP